MSILRRFTHVGVVVCLWAAAHSATAQLASRPAEEWTKTLEGPARVTSLKIDEVVATLQLKPGQTLGDIGAGPGLFEVALARAVGPSGRVFAVEIDAGFFPEIKKRADEAGVKNVQTVLGKFTDPALPANVDMALFHDVLHHLEDRAGYLKALAR
jgi:ubiquinone/menaquinone biosynthesis C-methylase UbiE